MTLDPAATCVTGTIRCLRHRSVRQAEAGFAAILLIGCAANAHAASVTNEDTEPSISEWYDGLTQPATGKRCCSVADCKPYDFADQ